MPERKTAITEKRIEAAFWAIDKLDGRTFKQVAKATGFPQTKTAAKAVFLSQPHAALFIAQLEKRMVLQILGVEDVSEIVALAVLRGRRTSARSE